MERLTEKTCSYSWVKDKQFQDFAVRLQRYEDLEEQGLLARLPCRVGDLLDMLSDLISVGSSDKVQNYTTGYRNGYRNGRIELLKYLLAIQDGVKADAEQALRELEGE